MDRLQTLYEIPLQRRQRVAAALLLLAFDLPAPLKAVACQVEAASAICPGLKLDEVGGLGAPGNREAKLIMARNLIEEMLAEISRASA